LWSDASNALRAKSPRNVTGNTATNVLSILKFRRVPVVVHKYAMESDLRRWMRLVETASNDFNIDAYHGTTADFDSFDPSRTRDIGMHFGTQGQANKAVQSFMGDTRDGANVIPVKLRLHNPLRVPDMFDTMRTTYVNRAKTFTLLIRGFRVTQPERSLIYDMAKAADKARRKSGGDWGSLDKAKATHQEPAEAAAKAFWQAIQASAERQGYDGFVYSNKVEGKGDSYVVFHSKNVRSRHAGFDPAKADSDKLMDGWSKEGSMWF
jgi:hypothetical protein